MRDLDCWVSCWEWMLISFTGNVVRGHTYGSNTRSTYIWSRSRKLSNILSKFKKSSSIFELTGKPQVAINISCWQLVVQPMILITCEVWRCFTLVWFPCLFTALMTEWTCNEYFKQSYFYSYAWTQYGSDKEVDEEPRGAANSHVVSVRCSGNVHCWFGRNPEKCPNSFIRGSSHEPLGTPRFPLVFSLPITYETSM